MCAPILLTNLFLGQDVDSDTHCQSCYKDVSVGISGEVV